MCVCVYVCVCVHACACVNAPIRAVRVRVCMCACVCTCLLACACVCVGVVRVWPRYPGQPPSPPMSMVQMEKIFSASVLADTLPKPTLVRLLRVKYSDAT